MLSKLTAIGPTRRDPFHVFHVIGARQQVAVLGRLFVRKNETPDQVLAFQFAFSQAAQFGWRCYDPGTPGGRILDGALT
jgi:hypothetical protein